MRLTCHSRLLWTNNHRQSHTVQWKCHCRVPLVVYAGLLTRLTISDGGTYRGPGG